jgi:hypothetical protein
MGLSQDAGLLGRLLGRSGMGALSSGAASDALVRVDQIDVSLVGDGGIAPLLDLGQLSDLGLADGQGRPHHGAGFSPHAKSVHSVDRGRRERPQDLAGGACQEGALCQALNMGWKAVVMQNGPAFCKLGRVQGLIQRDVGGSSPCKAEGVNEAIADGDVFSESWLVGCYVLRRTNHIDGR